MGNTSFANSRNNAEDQRSWKLAKAVHCKLYVMQTVQTLAKKKGIGYIARYTVTQTDQTLDPKRVAGILHVIK